MSPRPRNLIAAWCVLLAASLTLAALDASRPAPWILVVVSAALVVVAVRQVRRESAGDDRSQRDAVAADEGAPSSG